MSAEDPPSAASQVISKNNSSIMDIDSMKVPELKKRLKSMGLSITGNKAELIERLQEAYLSEKDGSLDGTLDDESLEEALLNDDPEQTVIQETLLINEELSFSSPEKVASTSVAKPLKKRVVIQTSTPVPPESPKIAKPLVLKRDNYPITEPSPPVSKKDHPLIEPPKSNEETKSVKITSAADRLQLRAKRFNIDTKAVSKPVVAPKDTTTAAKDPIVAVQAPASVKGSNLEVLRKRAERFGENVSTVMKQLENQEKLLKRKLKFNDSSSQSISIASKIPLTATEQERKRKRLERFGLKV